MKLPVDPAENLAALIRCPSVTPAEGGALDALEAMLRPLGFSVRAPVFSERWNARHRKPLRPPVRQWQASDVCGPHRRRAGRRRGSVDASALLGCHLRRPDVWPRRRRHEGRHRLLRRRGRTPRRQAWHDQGIGLVPDHRRRGRPGDQRHGKTARMGGGEGRRLGCGDRRRADQSGSARRHDQDRPARLDLRPGDGQRKARTCSLSAARRQPGARPAAACRRAARSGLRHRHQGFPADQSGDHLDRCRQSGDQRDPGARAASPSISASTTAGRPKRSRAKSTTGWTARRAGRPTGRAARSPSTSSSSGATGRAMSS